MWTKHDIKIIIDDCNAKIGKKTVYRKQVGKHSHTMNDNGKRLNNFTASKDLIIGSTMFDKKIFTN